jgi:hypothetical protein
VRAEEGLAPPLGDGDRPRGAGRDSDALAGRGEIPLLLPAAVAFHLVPGVEPVAFEKTVGQAKGHGGVIAPGAPRQIEGTSAEHVAHRSESTRPAKLRRCCDRVADCQTDESAVKAIAQHLGGGQGRGI